MCGCRPTVGAAFARTSRGRREEVFISSCGGAADLPTRGLDRARSTVPSCGDRHRHRLSLRDSADQVLGDDSNSVYLPVLLFHAGGSPCRFCGSCFGSMRTPVPPPLLRQLVKGQRHTWGFAGLQIYVFCEERSPSRPRPIHLKRKRALGVQWDAFLSASASREGRNTRTRCLTG